MLTTASATWSTRSARLAVRAKGLGEDAVALAVALAADLVGLLLSLGGDNGNLAVGLRLDLLALLRSLRPIGGGALLSLCLHSTKHRLRVLRGEIRALDAHVDDIDPEALGAHDHLITDIGHQSVSLVAHDIGDRGPR